MATLQSIRNRAGLLVAALGLALLAFILGDLFNSGGAWLNKFKDKAFVVNGEVVSTGTYQNRVAQMENYQKALGGVNSLNEDMTAQIREFVYEQMVKEMILDEQADKLGLAVTKEELNDMVTGENISPVILQNPMFVDPQTGQFSHQNLIQLLGFIQTDPNTIPAEQRSQYEMMKDLWMVIENTIKYHRLEEKYNALVSNAVSANDLDAKSSFEDSKFSSDIAYAVSRYSAIADSTVKVSDKEIADLYNKRKNNYRLDSDLRKVTYVTVNVVPSEEDFKAVETEMNDVREKLLVAADPALIVADYSDVPYRDVYYSESLLSPEEKSFVSSASIGDVHGPILDGSTFSLYKLVAKTVASDSIKLQVLVLPEGENKEAATAKVDSVLNVLKTGGSFAELSNALNPGSNGGEGVWVTEAQLAGSDDEFRKRCFAASTGEILKFENQPGFVQIVRVEEKTSPVSKVKLALVRSTVEVSDKTLDNIDNDLNQFTSQVKNATDFMKLAQEKKYNVMPEVRLSPAEVGLPQVAGSRSVIHWAFNEKIGSVKKFELSSARVVAIINSEIEAGIAPISEVSPMLKAELIRDKKAEKIIADLKSKNQNSLAGYASVMNSNVDSLRFVNFETANLSGGLGTEPIINVYAKHGELNKLQGPVKGNTGVYVLSVLNRADQGLDYNAAAIKQNLNRYSQYRLSSSALMPVLKEKLDVVDNRVKFF